MKRLAVALLLLAVFGTPVFALDMEWIEAHGTYLHFMNAQQMSEQQNDFDMYEINDWLWGEHPSDSGIMAGKIGLWWAKNKAKKLFPKLADITEVCFFCFSAYWPLHDMSHELDNQPGQFCGGKVTFNTLIRKPTTSTINWQELEVQGEKDIARILDPRSGMYASTGK